MFVMKLINLRYSKTLKDCISPYGRDLQKYFWNKAIFCKNIFVTRPFSAKIFLEQGYFLQTVVVGLLTHEEAPFEMHFFRKVVKSIFSTHPFAKTYF